MKKLLLFMNIVLVLSLFSCSKMNDLGLVSSLNGKPTSLNSGMNVKPTTSNTTPQRVGQFPYQTN